MRGRGRGGTVSSEHSPSALVQSFFLFCDFSSLGFCRIETWNLLRCNSCFSCVTGTAESLRYRHFHTRFSYIVAFFFGLLSQAIFFGGIDPTIRGEVWPFLLHYYSYDSTSQEREAWRLQKRTHYHDIQQRR